MGAYYGEFDPGAAQWLRELIREGLIPEGEVDERDIRDVRGNDLRGFHAVHLFAGIGGWPYALRLAGWPDDRPVWTGSCPCQPYSAAGKGKGDADHRNLWPEMFRLVRECRPPVVFGEQVASAAVIGRAADQDVDLQEVFDREAVLGVLRELQGEPGAGLQGLYAARRAVEEAAGPRAGVGRFQEVAGLEPGARPCQCRQAPGQGEGHPLRPGPGGRSKADQQRRVRVEWDRIRAVGAAGLECPIFGPDSAGGGVHDGQRPGGPLCPECHGEYVGAEPDFGDCVGDFGPAAGGLGRLVGADWAGPSTEAERVWLDGVSADLEGEGYAVGAVVLAASSVGAPHIRQRLYWVANRESQGRSGVVAECETGQCKRAWFGGNRAARGMADADGGESGDGDLQRGGQHGREPQDGGAGGGVGQPTGSGNGPLPIRRGDSQGEGAGRERGPGGSGSPRGVGDAEGGEWEVPVRERRPQQAGSESGGSSGIGFWDRFDLIPCRDGKARRVEPGTFPLAHGVPGRVGMLRGYGNAICPQTAAEFIKAYCGVIAHG